MNYAPQVMDLLCQRDRSTGALLVSGVPGMLREPSGLQPFTENRLNTDDVLETLTTLMGRLPIGSTHLERQGTFSISVPQRGRFRVAYITQRGGYALTITQIPLDAPALEEVFDSATAARAGAEFMRFTSGLLVLASSQPLAANRAAYALLDHLNRDRQCVITTVEPYVSYLVKHQKGVVLQCEIESDVTTMEDGVNSALLVGTQVIYIRGISDAEALRPALAGAKSNVLVVISVSRSDLPAIFPGGVMPVEANLRLGVWHVESEPGGESLLIAFEEKPS